MAITPVPEVLVTPIAYFPEKYFLENLIVRTDGSVLITAVLQKELWYVPGPARTLTDPVLVHAFDHPVAQIEPDQVGLVRGVALGEPSHRNRRGRA
jgi:hypothetical protein